jgi:hypothetical protein
MTQTQFDNQNTYYEPLYKIVRIKSSNLPSGTIIKDRFNNVIANSNSSTTHIVGIEKRSKGTNASNLDFSDYNNSNAGQLLAPINFDLATYIFSYNTSVNYGAPAWFPVPNKSYPPLECTPDYNQNSINYTNIATGGSGGSGGNGGDGGTNGGPWGHIGPAPYEFIDLLSEHILGPNGQGIPEFGEFKTVFEESSEVNTTNINRLQASDIVQIQITNLSDQSTTLIYPSEIVNEQGEFSLNAYAFTGNLYRADIMYSNNLSIIPFYFEGDNSNIAENHGLSNFLNVTIYPVPVVNNQFTIQMEATKDLRYTYQMLDLNGDIIIQKEFDIRVGEEIDFFNSFDNNLNFTNNIIVNKFTFEDGSTKVIQSIKSAN